MKKQVFVKLILCSHFCQNILWYSGKEKPIWVSVETLVFGFYFVAHFVFSINNFTTGIFQPFSTIFCFYYYKNMF